MSTRPREPRPPKDPFEERRFTIPDHRPDCRPTEDKYPKGRAIAAAFWISYFALHWLTILGVVESTTDTGYFFIMAVLTTIMAVAFEKTEVKK